MKTIEINSLVLAYLGDSVYELYVREFLIRRGIGKVKELQEEAKKYVTATRQALYLKKLIEDNFFFEEELTILRRARNTKSHQPLKGCDRGTYQLATALEAIIGYLKIEKQEERIKELMNKILREELC